MTFSVRLQSKLITLLFSISYSHSKSYDAVDKQFNSQEKSIQIEYFLLNGIEI